ncbi:MAG: hypothetical protein OXC55_05330 [Chloroflexi bacterium]|nr:hypothetical protein [Chloroflexota bacterium]
MSEENLARYVALQTVTKAQSTLFEAFVETLLGMDLQKRQDFLRVFAEKISESLQRDGSDASAHSALLAEMMQALIREVIP